MKGVTDGKDVKKEGKEVKEGKGRERREVLRKGRYRRERRKLCREDTKEMNGKEG